MAKDYHPADLSKLRTYAIGERAHRFDVGSTAGLPPKGAGFRAWWDALPPYLGVAALKSLAEAIVTARSADRPVVLALGAHVVKVGCSPIVCDLLNRGIVTAIAMNGATAIHDVEVALWGQTSEDVADTIRDGRFGMAEETPAFFAAAVERAPRGNRGLGAALGEHLVRERPRHVEHSILATTGRLKVPATVHVAAGTDTIHMHEAVATSNLMQLSMTDFRLICSVVADLAPASPGAPAGVWCNVGSAVILPEVFLKAVAVSRNLGHALDDITTANLDMIRHYRPTENVTGRPVRPGRGHQIIGHHEILLPLLRQALVELT